MQVKDIIIYPVKSMRGISLPKANAMKSGFQYDRRWMLIDEKNQFLTQRQIPEMALFQTSIADDHLVINRNQESLTVGLEECTHQVIQTQVWDDIASTIAVSRKADIWLSDMLGYKVRLVKIINETGRWHHNKNYDITLPVSLADGYPYLIAGTSSLDLLNRKLNTPVPMNRFRPNIVIDTNTPHEEDTWNEVKIGPVTMKNMKPCGRCQVITIDQETAEINNAPLKTLNQYRKSENNVLFGTNMMCTAEGMIQIGDEVIF